MILDCPYCHIPQDITRFSDWRNIKSDGIWYKMYRGVMCKYTPICKNCKNTRSHKSRFKNRDIRKDLMTSIPEKFASKESLEMRTEMRKNATYRIL